MEPWLVFRLEERQSQRAFTSVDKPVIWGLFTALSEGGGYLKRREKIIRADKSDSKMPQSLDQRDPDLPHLHIISIALISHQNMWSLSPLLCWTCLGKLQVWIWRPEAQAQLLQRGQINGKRCPRSRFGSESATNSLQVHFCLALEDPQGQSILRTKYKSTFWINEHDSEEITFSSWTLWRRWWV